METEMLKMKQTENRTIFAPTGRELSPRELIRKNQDDIKVRYSEAAAASAPCDLSADERDALCRIFLSEFYKTKPGGFLQ